MNIGDLTITSLETIDAFDIVSGNYLFTLDELQNATITQSQETTDITGKAGRKLATLKRNKAVTISGSNGLVSNGLLEMQTGSKFSSGKHNVRWTETVKIEATEDGDSKITTLSATLTYAPKGTTGAEIVSLRKRNTNGTLGEELEQGSDVSKGKFKLDNKTLTFYSGAKTGGGEGGKDPISADVTKDEEFVVVYDREVDSVRLFDDSDTYSGKCVLYVNAIAEDKCANVYRIQVAVPKADFSGEFSFEMGDNQTVHSFEATALAGACGAGGAFFTYTVFGEGAAA